MSRVRLRYRRGDEPDELACKTIDDAIDMATAQLASGEAWPVEVVVDGRVAIREPELVEEARRRLGEDDEDELR